MPLATPERQFPQWGATGKHSGATRPTNYYYDAASIEVIAVRERALIARFGYQPPNLDHETGPTYDLSDSGKALSETQS